MTLILQLFPLDSGDKSALVKVQTELISRNVDLTHMNRLDENVSASKQKKISATNGTISKANSTAEEDVLTFASLDEKIEIVLDCSLLTQLTTIRIYEETNGTVAELDDSAVFPTDFIGDNVVIAINGKGRDAKVTMQSAVAEGAARDVPWARIDEVRS